MKKTILAFAFLGILFSCEKNAQEAEILVSSVSLSQPTAEMIIGETIQLTATVLPSNASQNTITWASSKASVATVEAGRVTAIAEGAATITASTGGKSATCTVTVSKGVIAVTSVELNKTSLDLVEGESETLVATVKPSDATDKTVIWASSNQSVASVENGIVTAVAEGTATITATAGEKSAFCVLTVSQKMNYLTFQSAGTTSITLNNHELNYPELFYSHDGKKWTRWDYSELFFDEKSPLFIYGNNPKGFSSDSGKYSTFAAQGDRFSISGSIMSLLTSDLEGMTFIPSAYCFYSLFSDCSLLTKTPELPAATLATCCYEKMFEGCTSLTEAPKLPATTLAYSCYHAMFSGCTSLKIAPELPATTLAECCYREMFKECASLTKAPELPATTLVTRCYNKMFSGCTSITIAPELPATMLAESCYGEMFKGCTSLTIAPELPGMTLAMMCYENMFEGCSSLTRAPELPAETLTPECYMNMFRDCVSLTDAPELPATTLAAHCYLAMFWGCLKLTKVPNVLPATKLSNLCYEFMFNGCTSLTEAPKLPATTLAYSCYHAMFSSCTSLKIAPELPATKLAEHCYSEMFKGCSSLTKAPELPAKTLATSCYNNMFEGCSSLNYIKTLFTNLQPNCTDNWVAGVASTGIFVKSVEATWDEKGPNGIPVGWTVQTATN